MKKVPVTLVVEFEIEVQDNYTDDDTRFFVEENHCIDNHIDLLHRELQTNCCTNCPRANAYVGHLKEQIAKALGR